METESHLDHGEQALVGGGVGGDGEASRGVSRDDAVHGAPGGRVRLVLVRHSQIGDDHVHPVFVNLAEELKEKATFRTLCSILCVSVNTEIC